MQTYTLLGTYLYGNRNNIEVIAMSADIHKLRKIQDAITRINREFEGKDRSISNPKVEKIIEEDLSSVDIVEEATGFVHEIDITGIFRLEEQKWMNA
jgi:hypothetical protein